ncbi:M1 family metallopeptidase [Streptomyces albidoflavus]|uniref:M1 family metallopeptidase n=1 Tax=Streptomyces albidoflavus TaxID=1886 RepID=UPI00101E7093|nr:M1 family metallopeptidase [Streptomyces albidoflavus]RZE93341.1 metallopeptidase [Streptomyces albidoflavus]RZE96255.1 metallopeptidase [Streptomyces albidoflavus]
MHGTPGAAGVLDPLFPRLGNGGYDVRHYDLALDWAPATSGERAEQPLRGTARITSRATQNLSAFNLDLKGLEVTSVTVDGRPARYGQAGTELTVRPEKELDKGSTFRTTVEYAGRPGPLEDADGSEEGWLTGKAGTVALGEPSGAMTWFPGNHHPLDKATYTLRATVPKGQRAVSNGEPETLEPKPRADGRTTWTWNSRRPMASFLTTLAIGRYELSTGRASSDLPLVNAVAPGEDAEVLERLPEVLDWSVERFGAYPFDSYGALVLDPGTAGYALETQTRPAYPGAPGVGLVVHETAHQWFGNSVTPRTWQDIWLSEGFATYAEWLWEEDHDGPTAQSTFDRLYATSEDADLWAFPPADPPGPDDLFSDPVYHRGAMTLHQVRRLLGEDRFARLLTGWPKKHAYGHARTADFTAYAESLAPDTATREALTRTWAAWLRAEGKPDSARPGR